MSGRQGGCGDICKGPRARATQIKIEEVGGSERETHHKDHRVLLLFSHSDDIYSHIQVPIHLVTPTAATKEATGSFTAAPLRLAHWRTDLRGEEGVGGAVTWAPCSLASFWSIWRGGAVQEKRMEVGTVGFLQGLMEVGWISQPPLSHPTPFPYGLCFSRSSRPHVLSPNLLCLRSRIGNWAAAGSYTFEVRSRAYTFSVWDVWVHFIVQLRYYMNWNND